MPGIPPSLLLTAWLAAFWFLSPEIWHRCLLGLVVLPSFHPRRREILPTLKNARWLWLAAALLAWQTLSRLWSPANNFPCGWWLDSLLVAGLLLALFLTSSGNALSEKTIPAIALVSAIASLASLLVFYPLQGHDLANDRLRNVFFYGHGLNAVPTGFLFSFGALAGLWLATRPAGIPGALPAAASSLSLLGLLATQSRGPMLMFAIGLLVILLAVPERKATVLPLAIPIATSLLYLALLLTTRSWADAATDLLHRGSTGRLSIYQTYLSQTDAATLLAGTGMAEAPVLPKDVLGWRVSHPHSIYLTQLYQTGVPGLAMLALLVTWALRSAAGLAKHGESIWLALLAGSSVALLFDGGPTFTLYSATRIEILLVAVPAAIAVAKAETLSGGTSRTAPRENG